VNLAIQRLRAAIVADRAAFGVRLAELAALDLTGPVSPALAAQAALALHHAYGAVEMALSRLARALEGSLPEGPAWHQELIEEMARPIEGVRPAILAPATLVGLRRLLAFRHFLSHAYAVELDARQITLLCAEAQALAPLLAADLDALDAYLAEVARVG
jgi:hypothetical protein